MDSHCREHKLVFAEIMRWWRAAAAAGGGAGLLAYSWQRGYVAHTAQHAPSERYDAAVIGGGVIGLSVLRELAVRGHRVVLLEKEPHLVAGAASSGNSGIGCTGYDAPAGTLERALLRRSIQLHPELMRTLGLRYEHVNKCGAIVVARSAEQLQGLRHVVDANAAAGDPEAEEMSRDELLRREKSLCPEVSGGVLVPREVVVEPWLIPIAFAHSAQLHGADIFTGQHIVSAKWNQGHWRLMSAANKSIEANAVINCAGLYSDEVEQACLNAQARFKIQPRKGQFLVLEPQGGQQLEHVLQPVPTQYSKGVFVWATVWGTVVVGPTAEDQDSKTDLSINPSTAARLLEHATSMVPALKTARVLGSYSGLRPATEFRDYQISAHPDKNWITVGGIRSTGLTASPAIGEYVAFLHATMHLGSSSQHPFSAQAVDFCPEYSTILKENSKHSIITSLPRAGSPVPVFRAPEVGFPYRSTSLYPSPAKVAANPRVPSLEELALNYAARGDGKVEVFGRPWQVTHALTHHGLLSLSRRLRSQQGA